MHLLRCVCLCMPFISMSYLCLLVYVCTQTHTHTHAQSCICVGVYMHLHDALRFPTMRTAKRGSTAPHFLKGIFSENVVLSNRPSLLCYPLQTLPTNRGGSIAPRFPKSVGQKNWCYRTAACSDSEDSEGRFGSSKSSEGCP